MNNDQQTMGIISEANLPTLDTNKFSYFCFFGEGGDMQKWQKFFEIYRTPRLYLCDESRLSQCLGEKLSRYMQNMLLGLKDSTETFDKRIVNMLSLINSKLKNLYGAH